MHEYMYVYLYVFWTSFSGGNNNIMASMPNIRALRQTEAVVWRRIMRKFTIIWTLNVDRKYNMNLIYKIHFVPTG